MCSLFTASPPWLRGVVGGRSAGTAAGRHPPWEEDASSARTPLHTPLQTSKFLRLQLHSTSLYFNSTSNSLTSPFALSVSRRSVCESSQHWRRHSRHTGRAQDTPAPCASSLKAHRLKAKAHSASHSETKSVESSWGSRRGASSPALAHLQSVSQLNVP